MTDEMVSISEAAKILGITEKTLRSWELKGKLLPAERTEGGHRRYRASDIRQRIKDGVPQGILDEYLDLEISNVKKESEKKFEFMKDKGYVNDEKKDLCLAVILANSLDLANCQDEFMMVGEFDDEEEYVLGLIKATWEKLISRELVNYQPMNGPTGLVYYLTERYSEKLSPDGEEMNLCIESDVVVAKTRKWDAELVIPGPKREIEVPKLDAETFDVSHIKCMYGSGLSEEACIKINSDRFSLDLDNEVIIDLMNNSKKIKSRRWQDGLISVDLVISAHSRVPLKGIVTNEVGLELLKQEFTDGRFSVVEDFGNRLKKVGKLGMVDVYYHPKVDKFLLIKKGDSKMDSGYFVCPYIFYNSSPIIVSPEGLARKCGLLRYGKLMVRDGVKYYSHYDF